MAGTRKYKERVTSCVAMEAELKTLCLALGIELSECFRIGAMVKIDCMIQEQDPRISREDIDAYIRLNQQLVLDLKTAAAVFDVRQSTLAAHILAKADKKARGEVAAEPDDKQGPTEETVFVWDNFHEMGAWTPKSLVEKDPTRFEDYDTAIARIEAAEKAGGEHARAATTE